MGDRVPWVMIAVAVALLGLLPPSGPAAAIDPGPRPMDVAITFDTLPSGLGLELDGVRTPTPHAFTCAQGTMHTLTAVTPLSTGTTRHSFQNWTDGLTSSSRTFVCDTPQNFTAVYRTEHAITVETRPMGLDIMVNGALSPSPVFLWCTAGTTVDLRALPVTNGTSVRSIFGNWSDGGAPSHGVPCDAPATYTASYRTEYLVSVFSSPWGLEVSIDGAVSRTPVSEWCGESTVHSLSVPQNQVLGGTQLRFQQWEDGVGTSARTFRCDGSRNYTAVFVTVTTPPPTVDGIGWTPGLLLVLAVLISFVVAGVALAVRSTPRRVPIRMPLAYGVAPSGPRPSPPGSCPRCGTSAEPQWTYCMACGSLLR